MKSAQTIWLTEDRKLAVPDGDRRAKFLLVREGLEIAEARLKQVKGAAELAAGKQSGEAKQEEKKEPEKKPEAPEIQTRVPETTDRDPKHGKRER